MVARSRKPSDNDSTAELMNVLRDNAVRVALGMCNGRGEASKERLAANMKADAKRVDRGSAGADISNISFFPPNFLEIYSRCSVG